MRTIADCDEVKDERTLIRLLGLTGVAQSTGPNARLGKRCVDEKDMKVQLEKSTWLIRNGAGCSGRSFASIEAVPVQLGQ